MYSCVKSYGISGIDAYAVESNVCAGYLGQFVRDATVQVISAELDERGNGWYEVRFLYGDDFADGTMKWTDYATCFVMAAETGPSDGDACTVTDFAYSQDEMRQMQSMSVSLMSTPMNGFSLKNINGSVGGFYAILALWQFGQGQRLSADRKVPIPWDDLRDASLFGGLHRLLPGAQSLRPR